MIKKLKKIAKFGVYDAFDWDNSLKRGNKVIEFSKLNIIYGRNYSGKTTLSRVVRCLETGKLHPDYEGSEFSIEMDDQTIDQNKLAEKSYKVRVFNKDFIKDNLQLLLSDQGEISPFAILGDKNIEVDGKIKGIEAKIGKIENETGQSYKAVKAALDFASKKGDHKKKDDGLKAKLRNKAKLIKEDLRNGVVTYHIDSIEKDIEKIKTSGFNLSDEKELEALKKTSEEKAKESVAYDIGLNLNLSQIKDRVKEVVETKITPTVRLDELATNQELQAWVRNGMPLHKGRHSCGFCGNELTDKIWSKLRDHFNKESEDLAVSIAACKRELNAKIAVVNGVTLPDKSQFYSKNHEGYDQIVRELKSKLKDIAGFIKSMEKRLDEKNSDLFKDIVFEEMSISELDLGEIIENLKKLIEENNNYSKSLAQSQKDAREKLRLNEVSRYIKEIDYDSELKEVSVAKAVMDSAEKDKNDQQSELEALQEQLRKLQSELKDERKGAEKINQYLSNYFGHDSVLLSHEEVDGRGLFRIKRGDSDAKNLSEGESSLIAFCYFMARLHDLDTQKEDTIIWIDDPISSLDNNHIFFIFSLIEKELARPVDTGQGNKYFYKQLFLSTHNLDFLKYLKRLSWPHKKIEEKKTYLVEHFIVERSGKDSHLRAMPNYLERYATEFNYLFDKIKSCAEAEATEQNYDVFYNFGNNLRKFLESYLFYRYPSLEDTDQKVKRFFEGTIENALVARITNEMSHAEGTVERTAMPVDVPESKKLATFILEKIKEKDPDQYAAFLHSVKA